MTLDSVTYYRKVKNQKSENWKLLSITRKLVKCTNLVISIVGIVSAVLVMHVTGSVQLVCLFVYVRLE